MLHELLKATLRTSAHPAENSANSFAIKLFLQPTIHPLPDQYLTHSFAFPIYSRPAKGHPW